MADQGQAKPRKWLDVSQNRRLPWMIQMRQKWPWHSLCDPLKKADVLKETNEKLIQSFIQVRERNELQWKEKETFPSSIFLFVQKWTDLMKSHLLEKEQLRFLRWPHESFDLCSFFYRGRKVSPALRRIGVAFFSFRANGKGSIKSYIASEW